MAAIRVETNFSKEILERMKRHCDRVAITLATFVRLAAIEKIEEMEEKEAYLKEQRSKRSPLPRAPEVASGFDIQIKTPAPPPTPSAVEKVEIPDKIEHSMKRYTGYINQADNPIDRSIRLNECFDDIKQRVDEKIAHASFLKLQELLREQELLKNPTIKVPDDVPTDGDVDD